MCPCVRSAFSDTLSGDTRMGESNMNDASVQLSHLLGARQAVEPSYGSRGRPRLSARWATTVTQGLTTRDCDSRAGPWRGRPPAGAERLPPGWAFALLPPACGAGRFRGSPPGQGHREEGAGRITPEPSASARTGSEASATTGCPPPRPPQLTGASGRISVSLFSHLQRSYLPLRDQKNEVGPEAGKSAGVASAPLGPSLRWGVEVVLQPPRAAPWGLQSLADVSHVPRIVALRAAAAAPGSARGVPAFSLGARGGEAPTLPLLGCGVFAFR